MDPLTVIIPLVTGLVGMLSAWFIHQRGTNTFFEKRYRAEIVALDLRLRLCEGRHVICEAEVEAMKARIRINEHDTLGVIAADAKGIITDTNITACKIFQRSRVELIGLPMGDLVAPAIRGQHERAVSEMISSRRQPRQGWIIGKGCLPGGHEIDLEVSVGDSYYNEHGWVLIAEIRELKTRLMNPNVTPMREFPMAGYRHS